MKKFLSLVLALVMTMSLVTISAGAKDFTDDDKITYEEAVNVISEIGVVDGYADGKFNPTNTLTRQAAAKIICNLILGPTTAAELHADTAPYKDVPATSEFAGYIAYCAKEGIISGYADGTFKPGNTLTGYAFMKMLLGALGYDQAIEGYVGGNWSINVAKQAIAIGLNDSLVDEFNGVKAVTREEACLYAFNTLKSDLVEYDTTISTTINGATVTIGNSKAQAKKWGTSATRINNIKDDIYIQFAEQYFNKLVLDNTTDDFGRPARNWEFKGKDIGTYLNYDLLVEEYTTEVTGKDLYDLLGKSTIEDYDVSVYVDGETEKSVLTQGSKSAYFNETYMVKNNKDKVGATGDGVLTQVFVDSDEKEITVAVINTYLARAKADYSEKKDSVDFYVYDLVEAKTDVYAKDLADSGESKVTLPVSGEDFDVADVKENDAYLVTVAAGEIQTLEVAEVVADATITSFKLGSNVTADGTKYNYANTAEYDVEVLDNYTSTANGTNLKDTTYNIYLDQYGYLIGVDKVDEVDNYVFITGADSNTSNLVTKASTANAIFLDGTSKVIDVSKTKGNGVESTPIINKWYTYTVDKNDVYTLTLVSEKGTAPKTATTKAIKVAQKATKQGGIEIDKKHVSLPGNSDFVKVYGNDNTIYLSAELGKVVVNGVNDKENYAVITGVENVTTGVKNANLKTYTEKEAQKEASSTTNTWADTAYGVYTLYKDNGYVIAAVVVGDDAAAAKNLVYVNSDKPSLESYSSADDEWTWTREVIYNGEKIELTEKGDSLTYLGSDQMDQDEWYQIKLNSNGEVIGTELAATALDQPYEYIQTTKDIETAIDKNDTVLYEQDMTGGVKLKGSTLYAIANDTQRGVFVAEDVKIVFIQKNDNKKTTTLETGVENLEDVIDDLNKKSDGTFNYTLSAIIEDGAATVVVIRDWLESGTPTFGDVEVISGNIEKVVISTSAASVTVKLVEGKTSTDVTVAEVKAAAGAQLEADGYVVTGWTGTALGALKVSAVPDGLSANSTRTFDVIVDPMA